MVRDENGRFAKGNGGGPGRPKKKREQRFLEITLSACTFEDWKVIVKKAVAQARSGDKDARVFLAKHILPEPVKRHELTGADGGAIVLQWPEDDEGTAT